MAKNWMAYEAAEELIKGTDKVAVAEIGSRFPLFTCAVLHDGTKALIDILKAVPKTTARVVETGLKDAEGVEETEEEQVQEEVKETKKTSKPKAKPKKTEEPVEDAEDEAEDYNSMTTKELYKLCCDRGISGQCNPRTKAHLIEVLEANDAGAETAEDAEDDDWEEEEEVKDPYAGKTAKELYDMCKKRKISAEQRKKAGYYVALLKKDDASKAEPEEAEEEEDEDDWEI